MVVIKVRHAKTEAELTDPQKALNGERGEDGRQQLDPFPSPVEGGSSEGV